MAQRHNNANVDKKGENTLTQVDESKLSSFKALEFNKVKYREVGYNLQSEVKAALVIYLHGMSGRGSDNMTQMKQMGIYSISDYIDSCGMKAYFIVPQCPKNYSWAGDRETDAYVQNIIPLIKQIVKEKDIDPSQIYITGVSAGGRGIWHF